MTSAAAALPIFIAACEFSPHGREKLIRELCIIPVDRPLSYHWWLVKPSVQWDELSETDQRTANFLWQHHHQIGFNTGHSSLEDITNCPLTRQRILILCSGEASKQLLTTIFPNAIVANIQMAMSMKKMTTPYAIIKCPHYHSSIHCALLSCFKMYHYLFE